MSFQRLIFYHAMLGGWAAFAGWLLCESLFLQRGEVGWLGLLFTASLVGAAIGVGIALLGALMNGRFSRADGHRVLFSLGGGLVGGALGGLIGNVIVQVSDNFVLRALGWMFMGLGIGGIDGLFDRSAKKIRNGLLGGAIGGLLGGLCFAFISAASTPADGAEPLHMSSRAIGFVVLGLCIGLFIGLAQIMLREAWLTVEQGFRPGRQFVLNIPVTILGTSEKAQLPFIAFGAKGVEPIHLRIEQQADGTFLLIDNGSRTGTFINGRRVQQQILQNDDVIQLGPNVVRFREVVRHVSSESAALVRSPVPATVPTVALPEAAPVAVYQTPPAVPRPQPPPLPPQASPAAPRPLPKSAPAVPPPAAPRPQPANRPAAPPNRSAPAPVGKPCPKCRRPGTPIPGTNQFLCMGCDLKY
ncbi:MAG: FHA domain-containing protein [Gemmataceae bacterium]|nr:FHA domain-containing protein [Gemmataceae bacterium]